MTQSVGSNPINGTSAGAPKPYHQAEVLEREFNELHKSDNKSDELHPESVKKFDELHKSDNKNEKSTTQTPLADPSLKPTDGKARDQHPPQDKIDKAPSQQSDKDPKAEMLRSVWQKVHSLQGDGRTALCLSGGGVRSAAFNLGVLQGLARLGLLNRFHYL
jgi:hypothetical protein